MANEQRKDGGTAGSRDRALIEAARRQASDRERKWSESVLASANTVRLDEPARPVPVDTIPGYEIVREIHRGGQGVVYQAIQKSTKRRVAIKVMHEGPFAGSRDKARFEREVHILGQLDHPNVVTIHDSGSVAGSFYYVMDYISGEPLDLYMAGAERSIKDTLTLFRKICDAVNAAHLKGVIHRDLKPGNIRIHGDGEPRVLDFGLAKVATGDTTGEDSPQVMSTTGQFIGSLPWASPEQAAGEHAKIDVRTDVYSLGVILYQMLTGHFPYRVVGSVRDVLDNILSTPPARPSSINRRIDDDLDTIVLKALDKGRSRRYQSAGEFGRDIGHYLAGEPIEAKRDSGWYVLKKALGRYKAPVAVTAAFVVLLVFFGIRGDVLRREAEAAEHRATRAINYLDSALNSIDPAVARGKDPTLLRMVLDDAAVSVRTELSDEDEVRATIQNIIGRAYFNVADYEEAYPHLHAALETRIKLFGEKNADVAVSHHHLAELLKERGQDAGDYDGAKFHYEAALAIRRSLFGEESVQVAESLNDLGQLHFDQYRYDEAEGLLRSALDIRVKLLGRQHQDVASSMANVGSLLRDRGNKADLKEARRLLEDALRMRQELLGEHPHVAVSMNKLGLLLREEGEYEQARSLLEEALRMRMKLIGPDQPLVAVSLHNLALVLQDMGDFARAEPLFDQAIDIWGRRLDESHLNVAKGLRSRAAFRRAKGEYAMAKADCAEALRIRREFGSGPDRGSAGVLVELGRIHLAAGDLKAARSYLDEALEFYRESQPNSAQAATAESVLGECLANSGQDAEAEMLLRGSYHVLEDIRGPNHIETREARDRLARFFEERDQPEEAAQFRDESSASGAAR